MTTFYTVLGAIGWCGLGVALAAVAIYRLVHWWNGLYWCREAHVFACLLRPGLPHRWQKLALDEIEGVMKDERKSGRPAYETTNAIHEIWTRHEREGASDDE